MGKWQDRYPVCQELWRDMLGDFQCGLAPGEVVDLFLGALTKFFS